MLKDLGSSIDIFLSPPVLSFVNTVAKSEGNSGTTTFDFTLDLVRNGFLGPLSFSWNVVGTGASPASASDFVGGVLPSGTGTFGAGISRRTISVQVQGDNAVELAETFTINTQAELSLLPVYGVGTIVNDDVASQPENIVSYRGNATFKGEGGTNMGSYLTVPMIATSSTYTPVSGTSSHWTLPTTGGHPTPSVNGIAESQYVFNYSISDGSRTQTGRLTINRQDTMVVRELVWDQGRQKQASYTLNNVRTVANSTEMRQAATGSAVTDTGRVIACGAAPFAIGVSGRPTAGRTAVTCEFPNNPEKRFVTPLLTLNGFGTTSGGQNIDVFGIDVSDNNVSYLINFANNPSNCNVFDCKAYSIPGTPPSTAWSGGFSLIGNSVRIIDCQFKNIMGNRVRGGPVGTVSPGSDKDGYNNTVISRVDIDGFGSDAIFINYDELMLRDFLLEGFRSARPMFYPEIPHPDSAQICANAKLHYLENFRAYDCYFFQADGTATANGPIFVGSVGANNEYAPIMTGTNLFCGNFYEGINHYCGNSFLGADTINSETSVYAMQSVRQLSGVTGTGGPGANRPDQTDWRVGGAQNYITVPDSPPYTVYSTNGENAFASITKPGGTWAISPKANVKYYSGSVRGAAPIGTPSNNSSVGPMYFANLYKSTPTPPNYNNPSSIDPTAGDIFKAPYRMDLPPAGMDLNQLQSRAMALYSAKRGSVLDLGDGRINACFIESFDGTPKVNQHGRATLSASFASGIITVTLSNILLVPVLIQVRRSNVLLTTLNIPAGQLSASVAASGGATFSFNNDSGLLNPINIVDNTSTTPTIDNTVNTVEFQNGVAGTSSRAITGGNGSYTVEVVEGELPPGVTVVVEGSTLKISGTEI